MRNAVGGQDRGDGPVLVMQDAVETLPEAFVIGTAANPDGDVECKWHPRVVMLRDRRDRQMAPGLSGEIPGLRSPGRGDVDVATGNGAQEIERRARVGVVA